MPKQRKITSYVRKGSEEKSHRKRRRRARHLKPYTGYYYVANLRTGEQEERYFGFWSVYSRPTQKYLLRRCYLEFLKRKKLNVSPDLVFLGAVRAERDE